MVGNESFVNVPAIIKFFNRYPINYVKLLKPISIVSTLKKCSLTTESLNKSAYYIFMQFYFQEHREKYIANFEYFSTVSKCRIKCIFLSTQSLKCSSAQKTLCSSKEKFYIFYVVKKNIGGQWETRKENAALCRRAMCLKYVFLF